MLQLWCNGFSSTTVLVHHPNFTWCMIFHVYWRSTWRYFVVWELENVKMYCLFRELIHSCCRKWLLLFHHFIPMDIMLLVKYITYTKLCAAHFKCIDYHSQINYSPLRCNGIGLSDGECVERLWSYLRRFSHMTKEMRPSHRIDVLTHALLHYAERTTAKLGIIILCFINMYSFADCFL